MELGDGTPASAIFPGGSRSGVLRTMTKMDKESQPEKKLYLDDLYVGQRFTSPTYLMETARIKEFAAEFDPQPFHLDETAAQKSVFKGLAASGWHTAAVAMRLLVTGGLPLPNRPPGQPGGVMFCASRAKLLKSSPHAPSRIRVSSPCGARCSIRRGNPSIS